jgi:hypothetical protein
MIDALECIHAAVASLGAQWQSRHAIRLPAALGGVFVATPAVGLLGLTKSIDNRNWWCNLHVGTSR